MERIDKYNEIIKNFIPTRAPNVTVVEKKDDTKLYGFFVIGFDNHTELFNAQKLLFVPTEKAVIFKEEFSNVQTTKKSIENCIEIDVDDIRNIKLINAHTNHVQFSLTIL